MRETVITILLVAAAYEALLLDLSKVADLPKIASVDSAPRIAVIQLLPNPLPSTG